MTDVSGCLGCDVIAGRRQVPGGILHVTESWVVNHVVGPMNLGTLVLSPRDHVVSLADLSDHATAELGPLTRQAARIVESLLEPEQTYLSSWAHGEHTRKHLHIVVQPVTRATVEEYGGARSERLQALMLASGGTPPIEEIERFCRLAAALFAVGAAD